METQMKSTHLLPMCGPASPPNLGRMPLRLRPEPAEAEFSLFRLLLLLLARPVPPMEMEEAEDEELKLLLLRCLKVTKLTCWEGLSNMELSNSKVGGREDA